MFGWEYPPRHLGGLGVACQGLVRGLINQHVKVTLVLPFAADGSPDEIDILCPQEHHIKKIRIASLLLPYDSSEQYAERIHSIPRETAQIYGADLGHAVHVFTETSVEVTKHLQPDIVHAHDWMTYEAGCDPHSITASPSSRTSTPRSWIAHTFILTSGSTDASVGDLNKRITSSQ